MSVIRTLTILLSEDVDEHELDHIVTALSMVKGVADVVNGKPNNMTTFTSRRIAHDQTKERVRKALAMDLNNAEFYYDLVEWPPHSGGGS